MDNRIVSVDIVDGELIVTYQDGSTESLGPVPNLDPEELSAAVQRNAGDIAGLKRDVAALQEAVAGLGTSAETAEDDIDDLQEDVAELKNDLTNGTFPVGNAENAEQLTSTVGIEDNAPYLFRTSGGSNDIGDREDVKKIVGGTIAWNQLVKSFTDAKTVNGVTFTASGGAITVSGTATSNAPYPLHTVPLFANHVYFLKGCPSGGGQGKYAFYANETNPQLFDTGAGSMQKQSADTTGSLYFIVYSGQTVDFTFIPQLFDVTQELGTSIADYVFSLETATAGAGIAWLKKYFPKQFDSGYQAYDAGSMQSVSGLTEHRMVGFNLFNSEAGTVRIIGGMQYQITGTYTALSLDGTTITPDSNGKFTPTNSGTLTATGGNATDTCVHFVWDGEKDGTYEPYKTWSYALDDSITLRGIPKVDASGNLYYDGDEYLPDGTVNRRYGVVDLGTLTWVAGSNSRYNTNTPLPGAIGVSTDLRCVKYIPDMGASARTVDKSVCITNQGYVYIYDTAQTGDANAFKTAMSGVYLLYPLATPTTETADPYQATQIVDDFGTEEFVLADGAFPVPVGHNTIYQNNLRAKLEMSPDSPDGDGLYVVQQESGENTYVPLASTATIQDILTRLTALENA